MEKKRLFGGHLDQYESIFGALPVSEAWAWSSMPKTPLSPVSDSNSWNPNAANPRSPRSQNLWPLVAGDLAKTEPLPSYPRFFPPVNQMSWIRSWLSGWTENTAGTTPNPQPSVCVSARKAEVHARMQRAVFVRFVLVCQPHYVSSIRPALWWENRTITTYPSTESAIRVYCLRIGREESGLV